MRKLFLLIAAVLCFAVTPLVAEPPNLWTVEILLIVKKRIQQGEKARPYTKSELAKILHYSRFKVFDVRMAAAYALQFSDDPKAVATLEELTKDEDASVRGTALFSQIMKKAKEIEIAQKKMEQLKKTTEGKSLKKSEKQDKKKEFLLAEFKKCNSPTDETQLSLRTLLVVRLGDLYGQAMTPRFLSILKQLLKLKVKSSSGRLLRSELLYQLMMRGTKKELTELIPLLKPKKKRVDNLLYGEGEVFFYNIVSLTFNNRPDMVGFYSWGNFMLEKRMKELANDGKKAK